MRLERRVWLQRRFQEEEGSKGLLVRLGVAVWVIEELRVEWEELMGALVILVGPRDLWLVGHVVESVRGRVVESGEVSERRDYRRLGR